MPIRAKLWRTHTCLLRLCSDLKVAFYCGECCLYALPNVVGDVTIVVAGQFFLLHEIHMLSVLRNKLSSLQNENLMQAWFIQDCLTNSFE